MSITSIGKGSDPMSSIQESFKVKIPCSTANLGPGFDSIGMALNRYLFLHFSPAEELKITLSGDNDEQNIPLDHNNLIIKVMKKAFADHQYPFPTFHLRIQNHIPLARGLGSSAAAIVGGYLAANQIMGKPWSTDELFQQATRWEGHPDNVGPSLYGGVTIGSWDGETASVFTCDPPDVPILAVIPDQVLFTKKARAILPASYSRQEAVLASSRANLLTAALIAKRWDLLSVAMQDRFHQPYRQDLVPGLKESLSEAHKNGAWGVALSGAGPTLIAFVKDMEQLQSYFWQLFAKWDIRMEMVALEPIKEGAVVQLTAEKKYSTFVGNMIGAINR